MRLVVSRAALYPERRAAHHSGRLAAILTTTDNGRLRGHAGASLGKTGLAVAINEMLKRRSVAEWLRRGPVGRAAWTPAL